MQIPDQNSFSVSSFSKTPYRNEIDGLRALAVALVIFFHADYNWMKGGFLGVDVFFVISGYLIIGNVVRQIRHDEFSFLTFYARRIRRILPALFVTIAVTTLAALFVSIPSDMIHTAKSGLASLVSMSNIFFWSESGYFDTASEYKPFLHTWSLSVEEQFYLLLPAGILGLILFCRVRLSGVLAMLTVLCLFIAILLAELYPSASFFLLPTRAWEFLVGGMIAMLHSEQDRQREGAWRDVGKDLASSLGLFLIVASACFLHPGSASSALVALPAGIGAALVLAYTRPASVPGRILCNRILLPFGLASYSIYLWHQPIFVLTRQWRGSHLMIEPLLSVTLIVISVATGFVSWKLIEVPFRNAGITSWKKVHALFLTAALITVFIATVTLRTDGLPQRFSTYDKVPPFIKADPFNCRLTAVQVNGGETCSFGAADATKRVALIGDSHARRLIGVLDSELVSSGVGVDLYADSWCIPLGDIWTDDRTRNPSCRKFMQSVLRRVSSDRRIDTVVLVAQWPAYVDGWRTGDPGPVRYRNHYELAAAGDAAFFGRALKQTAVALSKSGKRVVLIASVPEFPVDVPSVIERRVIRGHRAELIGNEITSAEGYRTRNAKTSEMIFHSGSAISAIVYPEPVFCSNGECEYGDVSGLYYEDSNHLSMQGAMRLIEPIMTAIQIERVGLSKQDHNFK